MADFPNAKLLDLLLPATHDSLMYEAIDVRVIPTHRSQKALDAIHHLPMSGPMFDRWTRTQKASVRQQLDMGARFLDFRADDDGVQCYAVHTFACDTFRQGLLDVAAFLHRRPTEVIVLKYRSSSTLCDQLLFNLLHLQTELLLPATTNPTNQTLQSLTSTSKGCVVLMCDGKPADFLAPFDHEKHLSQRWLNSKDAKEVEADNLAFLRSNRFSTDKLLLVDWALTPQVKDIALGTKGVLGMCPAFNDRLHVVLAQTVGEGGGALLKGVALNCDGMDQELAAGIVRVNYGLQLA